MLKLKAAGTIKGLGWPGRVSREEREKGSFGPFLKDPSSHKNSLVKAF